MANNESVTQECSINKRLSFVKTSLDPRLEIPTWGEISRMTSAEMRIALLPFVNEKQELNEEARQLALWVHRNIHRDACRFSFRTSEMSKPELEELILEIRCLQEDTKRHRQD